MPNTFKLSVDSVEKGDNEWELSATSAHSMYTEVFDNRAVKAVLSKDADHSSFTISTLLEPAPLVDIKLAVCEEKWCEVENVFLRFNAEKIQDIKLYLIMEENYLDNEGRDSTEYYPLIYGVFSIKYAYLEIGNQERCIILES